MVENFENEKSQVFLFIKKTNKTGRPRTMNERNEKKWNVPISIPVILKRLWL